MVRWKSGIGGTVGTVEKETEKPTKPLDSRVEEVKPAAETKPLDPRVEEVKPAVEAKPLDSRVEEVTPPPAIKPVEEVKPQQPTPEPTPAEEPPIWQPPSGVPLDPHAQVGALIAAGHSPGEAQAIVGGQEPTTISGEKPKPKPQPPQEQPLPQPEAQPQPSEAPKEAEPDLVLQHSREILAQAAQPPAAPEQKPVDLGKEPELTTQAHYYTPYEGQRKISGIILHSADDNLESNIRTLTTGDPTHQVSAHYYVTRDGKVYHFVKDNDVAWHAGETGGKYAGYNNNNTIGIETEHVDGKQDWTDPQIRAEAQLAARLAKTYGLSVNNILGHSDIAPGRKQDPQGFPWNKFNEYVLAAMGGKQIVAGQKEVPTPSRSITAEQASKLPPNADIGRTINGIQITHYGYPGDAYWDENSGRGLTSRGNGIPGYSVGMTPEARLKIFGKIDHPEKATGREFTFNGHTYRDDDVGDPNLPGARIDVYDPMSKDIDKGVNKLVATERAKYLPKEFVDVAGRARPGGKGEGEIPRELGRGPSLAGQPIFGIPQAEGGAPPTGGGGAPGPSRGGGEAPEPPSGGPAGGGVSLSLAAPFVFERRKEKAAAKPAPEEEEEEDPMVAALTSRGFTRAQALKYAQSLQTVAPGRGMEPLKTEPPPAAPTKTLPAAEAAQPTPAKPLALPPPAAPAKGPELTLLQKQPEIAPRKVPSIVPAKGAPTQAAGVSDKDKAAVVQSLVGMGLETARSRVGAERTGKHRR